MSRRVLETLTYLARNHSFVAKILLQFSLPPPAQQDPENSDQTRGKAVVIVEENEVEKKQHQEQYLSITLLLGLLHQPLYLRSIAHLEQVRNFDGFIFRSYFYFLICRLLRVDTVYFVSCSSC